MFEKGSANCSFRVSKQHPLRSIAAPCEATIDKSTIPTHSIGTTPTSVLLRCPSVQGSTSQLRVWVR